MCLELITVRIAPPEVSQKLKALDAKLHHCSLELRLFVAQLRAFALQLQAFVVQLTRTLSNCPRLLSDCTRTLSNCTCMLQNCKRLLQNCARTLAQNINKNGMSPKDRRRKWPSVGIAPAALTWSSRYRSTALRPWLFNNGAARLTSTT